MSSAGSITSEENLDNWGPVEVVASRWRDMVAAAIEPGPYIFALTRTSIRKVVSFTGEGPTMFTR